MRAFILTRMTSPPRRHTIAAAFIVALATLASHWPALHAGFIWDDDDYVTHTRHQRTLDDLARIWTDTGFTPQFYPLTHTTFWVEYHLWGFKPMGYHAVNIALHAASSCLLALLLRRLGFAFFPAWGAGLLFAVHPLTVESVAWVTERKNTLCAFFTLLSCHALVGFYRLDKPDNEPDTDTVIHKAMLFSLALLAFVAALTSKTVAAVLPPAFALVLWWKSPRQDFRRLLPLVPMLILGALMGRITATLEKTHVGAVGQDWQIPPLDRALIAGRVVWFYLRQWVVPHPIMFIYPRWTPDPTAAWQYAFPLAMAALLAGLLLARRRIGKGPAVLLMIYLGCLAPASGFFDIYPMRFSFVADHFAYLALMPLAVATAAVAAIFMKRSLILQAQIVGVIALIAMVLGCLTWSRAHAYRDSESLWFDNYLKNPTSMFGLVALASTREAAKLDDHALGFLEKAEQHHPDHPYTHTSLATFYERHNRPDDALASYLAAISKFRGIEPERGFAHLAAGRLLKAAGRHAEAIPHFELALECRPLDADAAFNLGQYRQDQQRWPEAAALFERVVEIRPGDVAAWYNLGYSHQQSNRPADAANAYGRVLELDPAHARAHNNLGVLLASANRPADAVPHFEAVLKQSPDDLAAMRNLAVTLLRAGRPAPALRVFQLGAQTATRLGNQAMADDFTQRAAALENALKSGTGGRSTGP